MSSIKIYIANSVSKQLSLILKRYVKDINICKIMISFFSHMSDLYFSPEQLSAL